jgi:hypothetical protein
MNHAEDSPQAEAIMEHFSFVRRGPHLRAFQRKRQHLVDGFGPGEDH